MRGGSNHRGGGTWRGSFSGGRGFRGNRGNRPAFSGNQWQNRDRNNSSNFSGQSFVNRPTRETPGERLTEAEIGVTEYLSKHEGFNGIIKSRYADFQVSEINEQGEEAVLTDTTPPKPPADEAVDEDEDLLLSKYNVEILPMAMWDKINKLVVGTLPPEEKVEIDVSTMSKEDRTKIHEAIKKAFGGSIVGSTVNIEDKKLMRFEKFRRGVRIDNRIKWVWPGEYVHFIVHKENCDTMEAAQRIGEMMRMQMKPQVLGYAGTKDRRAKTSQWFSLRKVDPRKINAACRHLRDITLGNYTFHQHALRLGRLRGNKFRIALRNVTAAETDIEPACAALSSLGFLNYYGLQRFGTRKDVPTFRIGMNLLQGNYKQAIDLILQEHPGPLERALAQYKLEGPSAGACAVPRAQRNCTESRLLTALALKPRDYLTAMHKVPRNTRLLYLHAYQSLVWNKAVSERIRRHGLQPAPGDAVPLHETHVKGDAVPLHETHVKEDLEDEESETEENDTESPKPETDAVKPEEQEEKIPVKILTQEDVDSGRYSIEDIVMPLPGFRIQYPPNMVDYYETLLKNDGLTLDLISKHKSYSLSGAYRRVVVRPRDLTWQCVRYTDPFADLIASDRDRLEKRELTGILPDGKYKALLLTFTLPVSCYATMALRELLKVDTSSLKQAQQNNYHKRKISQSEQDSTPDGGEKKAKGDGDSGGIKADQ